MKAVNASNSQKPTSFPGSSLMWKKEAGSEVWGKQSPHGYIKAVREKTCEGET